jgi:hypothetical protein
MAWIINILLISGVLGVVAGFFVKFIPFINRYKLPVQIISICILVLGVWLKGGQSERLVWQAKVKELEEKLAQAEEASKKVNTKIVTKVVERVKVVKGQTEVIIKEVPKIVTKEVDAKCEIPVDAVNLYNRAAKGVEEPKK